MNELDQMSLSEIIKITSLCLSAEGLVSIWRDGAEPQKNIFNPNGTSALEELKDKNLANELIEQAASGKLWDFLFAHEAELDKTKLVLEIVLAYKKNLAEGNLSPEFESNFRNGLAGAKKLLEKTNKTYPYVEMSEEDSNIIERIELVNTREEATDTPRAPKPKNIQRLNQLESEEDISKIIAFLTMEDLKIIIPYSEHMAAMIWFMIAHNTAINITAKNSEQCKQIVETEQGFMDFLSTLKQADFIPETKRAIEVQIEDVDIDKLLLCCAFRYMKALENESVAEDQVPEAYRIMNFIHEHIIKNSARVEYQRDDCIYFYDKSGLTHNMRKFVRTGDKIEYLTARKCIELKDALIKGEVSLNSLTKEEYNALLLSQEQIDQILKLSPDNYIFFLKAGVRNYSKRAILSEIIRAKQCSQELLKMLCEKTDITCEEIRQLFDLGIISTSDLESIKNQREAIITDENLYEKYKEHLKSKDEEESEKTRIQLERYALAYRKLELAGKTEEEIEQRAEELIITIGEDIKPEDFINLYGLDVIPLKVAVDWGGEDIIEELLKAERLKPLDARYLRDKGLLNEDILARLFQNCPNMSYAYQLSLVNTVFDGQTPEEREAKQKLEQYYHIENGLSNVWEKRNTRQIKRNPKAEDEPQLKIKMRDPGAKYNLLSSLDKDVKIEEGIIDGHIIFHYPNIDGGTVLIEKLHKITTNKDSGLIEIKADNGCATYIISEEEFIKIKSSLIQNGKVDRTALTQRWFRKPGYWIAHTGKDAWERGIKGRFQIDSKNPRYSSPEDLAKMEELLRISAESRDVELR